MEYIMNYSSGREITRHIRKKAKELGLPPNKSKLGFLTDQTPPPIRLPKPTIGDTEPMPTRRLYETFEEYLDRVAHGYI